MTILEQLAATTEPAWADMIEQRRAQSATPEAARATVWGRKGESHYKDGKFTKK